MLLVTHARGSTYQGYEAPNANNDLVMHTAHKHVASTGYLIKIGAKLGGNRLFGFLRTERKLHLRVC